MQEKVELFHFCEQKSITFTAPQGSLSLSLARRASPSLPCFSRAPVTEPDRNLIGSS